MVQMLLGENALQVLERVHEAMPAVRGALPEDVVLTEVYDRMAVGATLRTVGKSLAEGGLLVVLVLFAMLGSLRAGVLVATVIPLSMLGAVIGMVVLEVPGNLMSLGALDFGLLVDGAVVMVESVFHHFHVEQNDPRSREQQVADVARGVARPVLFTRSSSSCWCTCRSSRSPAWKERCTGPWRSPSSWRSRPRSCSRSPSCPRPPRPSCGWSTCRLATRCSSAGPSARTHRCSRS